MASMAALRSSSYLYPTHKQRSIVNPLPVIVICQQHQNNNNKSSDQMGRREIILRSSEAALIGAIFNLSGTKPNYLGIQKNNPSLALCPSTKNCISTSENASDLTHYAPPWNYNPDGRRGNKSREDAMEELLQVIKSTKADKSKPQVVEKKDDYVHVEYESPILGTLRLELEKKGWDSEKSF
ncbi:hypothetical protein Vadar_010271 [Vaccinium darrowii]|uniref:Uncharacterized protein n=1 Tax=Vaccinium darrowii TaxID=229202 RepID=A0ACB7Y6H8_9ERIC|nr:hypothetical protein Vadar_010271 [Vaccinium darrowii]